MLYYRRLITYHSIYLPSPSVCYCCYLGLLSAKYSHEGVSGNQQSIGVSSSLIIPAVSDKWVSQSPVQKGVSTVKSRKRRPQSAKKPANNSTQKNRPLSATSSTRSNISVSKRPYSAHGSVGGVNENQPASQPGKQSRKKRTIITGWAFL